jgi:hypothetical protein
MRKVMKNVIHGSLKGGSNVFEPKGHNIVGESATKCD